MSRWVDQKWNFRKNLHLCFSCLVVCWFEGECCTMHDWSQHDWLCTLLECCSSYKVGGNCIPVACLRPICTVFNSCSEKKNQKSFIFLQPKLHILRILLSMVKIIFFPYEKFVGRCPPTQMPTQMLKSFWYSVPKKSVRAWYHFKWFFKVYNLSYSDAIFIPWVRKSSKSRNSTYI